jgi:hypothetical protein
MTKHIEFGDFQFENIKKERGLSILKSYKDTDRLIQAKEPEVFSRLQTIEKANQIAGALNQNFKDGVIQEDLYKSAFNDLDNIIEKAMKGEGSRGGKIIGHTKSGKPIYAGAHESHKSFSKQDHLDAVSVNYKKEGETSLYNTKKVYRQEAKWHQGEADNFVEPKSGSKSSSNKKFEDMSAEEHQEQSDNTNLDYQTRDKHRQAYYEKKGQGKSDQRTDMHIDKRQAMVDMINKEKEERNKIKKSDESEIIRTGQLGSFKYELNTIEKSSHTKAMIGDERTWDGKRYKKQVNGKWLQVSDAGMTKREHYDKAIEESNNSTLQSKSKEERDVHNEKSNNHFSSGSKLSPKEHSDEEVGLESGNEMKRNTVVKIPNLSSGGSHEGIIHSVDKDGKYAQVRTTTGDLVNTEISKIKLHENPDSVISKLKSKKYAGQKEGESYYSEYEGSNGGDPESDFKIQVKKKFPSKDDLENAIEALYDDVTESWGPTKVTLQNTHMYGDEISDEIEKRFETKYGFSIMEAKTGKRSFEKSEEQDIFTEDNLPGYSSTEILKAIDTSNLIKKEIQVKGKDGKMYTAHRWVSKDSGQPADTGKDPKKIQEVKSKGGVSEDEKTANHIKAIEEVIADDSMKQSDKFRSLVSMGIYDIKTLMNLVSGATYQSVRNYIIEAGLSPSDFAEKMKKETSVSGSPTEHAAGGFPPADMDTLSEKKWEEVVKAQRMKRAEELGISYKDKWRYYDTTLDNVMNIGYPKSLIAYGTGGVGKSYNLDVALQKNKIRVYDPELDPQPHQYDAIIIKGSGGKKGMWEAICKNKDKLIIFDDMDTMWDSKNEDQQNILKGMLDTTGEGQVEYMTAGKDSEGNQLPKRIKFTGQVIFISNLERKDFPQPLIQSRCASVDLTMTKDQTLEKLDEIKDKVKIKGKGEKEIEVSKEARLNAMEFMRDHKKELPLGMVNARIYGQAAFKIQQLMDAGQTKELDKQVSIALNLV